MSEEHLLIDQADGLLTLTINRPQVKNALSEGMLEKLASTIFLANDDNELRGVVIESSTPAIFSSGYDLGVIGDNPLDIDTVERIHAPIRRAAKAMQICRHPVVAVVRGGVYGAALDLVAHADLRIAETGARYVLPAAKLGYAYSIEGMQRLVAILGLSQAQSLMLHGQLFEARAHASAMFQYVWDADIFEAQLSAFLGELRGRAPLAVRAMKSALNEITKPEPAADHVKDYYRIMTLCMNSVDAKEGRTAFLKKRKPAFKGV